MKIRPVSYWMRKLMQRSRVVLPEPLGPTTATVSPLLTARLTFDNAGTSRKRLPTPMSRNTLNRSPCGSISWWYEPGGPPRWIASPGPAAGETLSPLLIRDESGVAVPLLGNAGQRSIREHRLDRLIHGLKQRGVFLPERDARVARRAGEILIGHAELAGINGFGRVAGVRALDSNNVDAAQHQVVVLVGDRVVRGRLHSRDAFQRLRRRSAHHHAHPQLCQIVLSGVEVRTVRADHRGDELHIVRNGECDDFLSFVGDDHVG